MGGLLVTRRRWMIGARLGARELQVVTLLAQGLTPRQIGDALGVSEASADGYIRRARDKLGAATACHLVAIAMRDGLIT